MLTYTSVTVSFSRRLSEEDYENHDAVGSFSKKRTLKPFVPPPIPPLIVKDNKPRKPAQHLSRQIDMVNNYKQARELLQKIYIKNNLSPRDNSECKDKLEIVMLHFATPQAREQGYREAFSEYVVNDQPVKVTNKEMVDEVRRNSKGQQENYAHCCCSRAVSKYYTAWNINNENLLIVGECCSKRMDEECGNNRNDDFVCGDDEVEFEELDYDEEQEYFHAK